MSLTPGDPTLWSAVLFVRKGPFPELLINLMLIVIGPYSPAVIRFAISFPPNFPNRPPLIVFNTDIFHPLIVPLTTHTFSTGFADNEPVSATDEGRLPPGGFSLRHGFPRWFERPRGELEKTIVKLDRSRGGSMSETDDSDGGYIPDTPSPFPRTHQISTPQQSHLPKTPEEAHGGVSVSNLLTYVVSSFLDVELLDTLPLEVAGNPGAWHAWRSYRRMVPNSKRLSGVSQLSGEIRTSATVHKQPGEWNWEGVWEKRVRGGIESSLSDQVLFGDARRGGDEMVGLTLKDAA